MPETLERRVSVLEAKVDELQVIKVQFPVLHEYAKSTDRKLDALAEEVGHFHRKFDGLVERVDSMAAVGIDTRNRVQRVEHRLDGVDQRLDGMDQRLDGMDQRLDGMDQRLERLEQGQTGTHERLDRVEETLTELLRRVPVPQEQ